MVKDNPGAGGLMEMGSVAASGEILSEHTLDPTHSYQRKNG